MMKRLIILALALLSVAQAHSQDLKDLAAASEVSTGTLANGIRYYIVTNRLSKGIADMAVVQDGWTDRTKAKAVARKSLVSLPHFGERKPYEFLAENGVGYNDRGYVSYRDNSTIYRFSKIPVSRQEVLDSTLLMAFDLAANSPYEQAIVICGDVDAAKVKERMGLFSMTLSRRQPLPEMEPYSWQPIPIPYYYYTENISPNLAAIRVTYASPRVPDTQMGTLQSYVTKQYAAYLGIIFGNRVRSDFRRAGLPLADMRYRYRDSSSGAGDEQYTFTVITSAERYAEAVAHVAAILSDLDTRGATLAELQDAKDQLVSEAIRDGGNVPVTNDEYIRRCIASYRFHASLASDASVNEFFISGRLDAVRELELFNSYVFALLDPESNMTTGFDTPGAVQNPELAELFDSSWRFASTDSSGVTYSAGYGDAQNLRTPTPKSKIKIKSETLEPVSGGSLWTFTNGMRVVFRKTAVKGQFYYAMMLRGGSPMVKNLAPGENAFVGDMLAISDISGKTSDEFRSMLRANGVTMESDVTLSDFRITGTAPKTKDELVLRSLLSIALDRKPNRESFEYYKTCEASRLELERFSDAGIRNMMDNLLCPDTDFPSHKRIEALQDDLPERAEAYFKSQFSRMNDGVLVFIGDLDEERLKKLLCDYLCDFQVSPKFAARPRVNRKNIVGRALHTVDFEQAQVGSGSESVHVAVTAPVSFNSKTFLSLYIAAEAFRAELAEALASVGAYAVVTPEVELFPDERMTIYIDCKYCDEDGLPEGVSGLAPVAVMGAVRVALLQMLNNNLSPLRLSECRAAVRNSIDEMLSLDNVILEATLLRYGEGKDIVSGCREAVDKIGAGDLASLFGRFSEGGSVEYVIQ